MNSFSQSLLLIGYPFFSFLIVFELSCGHQEAKDALEFVDALYGWKRENIDASRRVLGISLEEEMTEALVAAHFEKKSQSLLPTYSGGVLSRRLADARDCLSNYCRQRDSLRVLCSENFEAVQTFFDRLPANNAIKKFLSRPSYKKWDSFGRKISYKELDEIKTLFKNISYSEIKRLRNFFIENIEYWFLAIFNKDCSDLLIERINALCTDASVEHSCLKKALESIYTPWWVPSEMKEQYEAIIKNLSPSAQNKEAEVVPLKSDSRSEKTVNKVLTAQRLYRVHSNLGTGLGNILPPR